MNDIVGACTSLTLPWPISVNAYKMPIRKGRILVMVLTPRARKYRLDVAEAIAKQLGRRTLTPYETPVQLDIELRPPDRRVRDISNHIKTCEDGLVSAGVLRDDSLVDVLVVRRGRVIKDGCVNILIAPLDAQPDLPDASEDAAPLPPFTDEV